MLVYISKDGRMSFDSEASAVLVDAKVATIKYYQAVKEVTVEGFNIKPENDAVSYYMLVTGPKDNKHLGIPVGFYGRWVNDLGPNYDLKVAGDRSFSASVDGTKIKFALSM